MAEQDKDQKTEDATAKRLEEAVQKGQVVNSQEVKTLFMLLAATVFIAIPVGFFIKGLTDQLAGFMGRMHEMPMDTRGLPTIFADLFFEIFLLMLIPFSLFVMAGIVGSRIQHPGVFSFEKLKFELNSLNPVSGLKKLFSPQKLFELAKSIAKISVVVIVIFLIVWPERDNLDTLIMIPFEQLPALIQSMAFQMFFGVTLAMMAIAAADYAYQKYQYLEQLKMTKQEVKDERKQTEGDPEVRRKLARIRMERTMQRMMAAVPDADVVITNPTHYAVALSYKHGEMAVPKLVAKGVDHMAARIREVAVENGVPIVENPPVARALYAVVDIDEEVPPDHYKAVAEVIGYVMRLKRSGITPRPAAERTL